MLQKVSQADVAGMEDSQRMATPIAAPHQLTAAAALGVLRDARARTLAIVASISETDLERVHSTLMSPLVWDLGHIAAFEDLWMVHRFGGRPLLREDLADVYDAFETPRSGRGELPFLRPPEARAYLEQVRDRTLEVIDERGLEDGNILELVVRHEQQHCETMLQTIELARLRDYELTGQRPEPVAEPPHLTGLELTALPGGECLLGAGPGGFAYDNERPRHRTDVRGYLLGRAPITNATYLTFVEGGGYERREWWSDEGWAWKEQYDITRPMGWTATLDAEWRLGDWEELHPARPVIHVSWFEADAFARAHGARLPTESEWERAATWNHDRDAVRTNPWGEDPLEPGVHANVDQLGCGTSVVGAHLEGATPDGIVGLIGDVWEWTSTPFHGYPGFRAYPYREYSEVFFGPEYRVLRGGSWATRTRVVSSTFRNWDYPGRRQIFAGFRVARDLEE